MANGLPSAALLGTMASSPMNALSRMVSRVTVRQQQLRGVARLFSSNHPPPRSGKDGGSGGSGSFRLPRPAARSGNGQPPNKRKFKNANTTSYESGVRGTRANTITLFPGNFQDSDDAFADEDASYDASYVDEDPEEARLREYLKQEEERTEAQRQKWLEKNKLVERVSEIDERGRSYGRGGRKTAEARVWIQPGLGEVVVNRRCFTEYFDRLTDRQLVVAPFVATDTCGKFDVQAIVKGGGLTGQAGAVRLGVARALNAYNPDAYRPALKILKYLTRDARKVERKKVGHVKARKSPQWVRR